MPLSYGCNQCWSLSASAHQLSFYVTARNVFSCIQTLWWTSLYTALGHQQKRTKIRQRDSFYLAFVRVSQIKNAFGFHSGHESLSYLRRSVHFSQDLGCSRNEFSRQFRRPPFSSANHRRISAFAALAKVNRRTQSLKPLREKSGW